MLLLEQCQLWLLWLCLFGLFVVFLVLLLFFCLLPGFVEDSLGARLVGRAEALLGVQVCVNLRFRVLRLDSTKSVLRLRLIVVASDAVWSRPSFVTECLDLVQSFFGEFQLLLGRCFLGVE